MRQSHLNNKWLLYGFFTLIMSLTQVCYAQSIIRQSISSYGSSTVNENVLVRQTAGQSFNTVSSNNVTQGFQQPITFSVEEIIVPAVKNLNVMVYPNPASHSITITSEKELEQSVIRVTDINGKYLLSEKVPNLLSHTMNCADWSNGVYLITIYDSMQNTKTLRLIISK